VCLSKVLIILSNTKYVSSIIVFSKTLQQLSLVHISYRQVDVGYKKINIKRERREASLYSVMNYNNIIPEKNNIFIIIIPFLE